MAKKAKGLPMGTKVWTLIWAAGSRADVSDGDVSGAAFDHDPTEAEMVAVMQAEWEGDEDDDDYPLDLEDFDDLGYRWTVLELETEP